MKKTQRTKGNKEEKKKKSLNNINQQITPKKS